MKDKFKICTGYSDHTVGNEAIKIAYMYGAEIIEKHFSNTINSKSFRDHQISLNRRQLDDYFLSIENLCSLVKQKTSQLTNSEKKQKNLFSFRRSIYAKTKILKGDSFNKFNITCLRPFIKKGYSSNKYFHLIGKKAKKKYEKLDLI